MDPPSLFSKDHFPTPDFIEKSRLGGTGVSTSSGTKRRRSDEQQTTDQLAVAPPRIPPWPRYLVLSSQGQKKLKALSVFVISKTLHSIAGEPESVSKLRNGDLLVECKQKSHSDNLLKITSFAGLPVSVEPHKGLNSSRGVIRSRDLDESTEEEMVECIEGVTHARRIKIRRGDREITTSSIILTFDTPKPPSDIKAGYLNLKVRAYIPNPLRCFKCQKFGHSKTHCNRARAICARCGKEGHGDKEPADCQADPKCPNCQGDHPAYDKTCPKWIEEKAIQTYKAEHGCTFAQARVEILKRQSNTSFAMSFAQVVSRPVVQATKFTGSSSQQNRPAGASGTPASSQSGGSRGHQGRSTQSQSGASKGTPGSSTSGKSYKNRNKKTSAGAPGTAAKGSNDPSLTGTPAAVGEEEMEVSASTSSSSTISASLLEKEVETPTLPNSRSHSTPPPKPPDPDASDYPLPDLPDLSPPRVRGTSRSPRADSKGKKGTKHGSHSPGKKAIYNGLRPDKTSSGRKH